MTTQTKVKMTPKKVEVVEPNGPNGWAFRDSGVPRHFGDIFTHERGQYYINLGWCKCTETGHCGERKTGVSKITPDNVVVTLPLKSAKKSK